MKLVTLTLITTMFTTPIARADVLWDNGEWNLGSNVVSNRNGSISDAWIVDDVIFDQPVIIESFEWTALMPDDFAFLAGDFLLMDESFNKQIVANDLEIERKQIDMAFGFPVYRVTLPNLDFVVDPGRYYIGGRPVGDGKSFSVTGLIDEVSGESEAFFRSAELGYPDWVSMIEVGGEFQDAVFKVHGTVIPAPGCGAIIVLATVITRPRGRREVE